MSLLKSVERCLRDIGGQGVEISFEATVRRNGLPGDQDSQLVALGWEIVEREDSSILDPINNIRIWKLWIPSQIGRIDTKASG